MKHEQDRRAYLEQLVYIKAGLIREVKQEETDLFDSNQDFIPVHRGRTLTSLRQQATERLSKLQLDRQATPATAEQLTEAEKLFQERLTNKVKH